MPATPMSFTSPLSPGKCATPVAITLVEQEITFPVDGSAAKTGRGRIAITSDVDWLYSDAYNSGRKMLIAATQPLVLPFYDDLTISASGAEEVGTLYAMVMDNLG